MGLIFVCGGGRLLRFQQEVEIDLNDGIYRIGKLTPEERREKILKYRQKRHERNFKKKIKYVCRKTLADSRPRVRGRFARNDDLGAVSREEGSEAQAHPLLLMACPLAQ